MEVLQIFEQHEVQIPEDNDAETTWEEEGYGTRRIPGQTTREPTEAVDAEQKTCEIGDGKEGQGVSQKPKVIFGNSTLMA